MNTTRKAVLAIAGVVVLASGGIAYAATQGTEGPREKLIDGAAKRLNVSPDKLRSALRDSFFEQLDAAVAAGKLTKQQADQIKQRVAQHGGMPPIGGPGLRGPGGGPHRGFAPLRVGANAAATYLGMSQKDLLEQLRSGKSLADVASAKGKSADGLQKAIVAALTTKLNAAVAAKRITDEQRQRIISALDQRVAKVMQRKGLPKRGQGRGMAGQGRGMAGQGRGMAGQGRGMAGHRAGVGAGSP